MMDHRHYYDCDDLIPEYYSSKNQVHALGVGFAALTAMVCIVAYALGVVAVQRDQYVAQADSLTAEVAFLKAHPTYGEERCLVKGVVPIPDTETEMIYALCSVGEGT